MAISSDRQLTHCNKQHLAEDIRREVHVMVEHLTQSKLYSISKRFTFNNILKTKEFQYPSLTNIGKHYS